MEAQRAKGGFPGISPLHYHVVTQNLYRPAAGDVGSYLMRSKRAGPNRAQK